MKFKNSISLKDLCAQFDAKYAGDGNLILKGINEIHVVEKGDIIFVDNHKYFEKAFQSAASAIIIHEEVEHKNGKSLIVHPNPFELFNEIASYYYDESLQNYLNNIHLTAQIDKNVHIGKNVEIGKNSIISSGVYIGNNVKIGENVIIGPNTILGYNAFYYKTTDGRHQKMVTCGSISVEDDVDIGALCSVDAGVTGTTSIGKGTKIDNQVQIGHDTKIGSNCLFAAGVGIAGCVIIEDNVTLWGQVGVASGVLIESFSTVLAQSGVSKSLKGNKTYFGSPCIEAREKFKEMATLRLLSKK